ncbi:hypothetical protein ACWGQ2_02480 [Arthrobacter sp. NPDC055585]
MRPHHAPTDVGQLDETAGDEAAPKRKPLTLGGTLAGLIVLLGISGLVIGMNSEPGQSAYNLGVLLTGLAVSALWLVVPFVIVPPFYRATQSAVVEPSPTSRRWGAVLSAAAIAPSVVHGAVMVLGTVLAYTQHNQALEQTLDAAVIPLRWIMVAVPVLLFLVLVWRIKRSGAVRAQGESEGSVGK